ncbi:hypothetical protein T11_5412 [Trichinella zimbabwensis]|uniref:Uncharacterized protein n=1 Tax=Trichinella zimbabwensis TaxID=268475 RepID=A0A0V1H1Q8_9BILA|nr:hypothetical protein T11_5412 [Trichinella zimbabwensis]
MICTFETSAHQFERTESVVCGKSARRLRSQLLNDLMKRNEYQDKIIQQLLKSLKENVILCENIVRKDNMTIKEVSALTVKNSSSLNDKVEELRDHISSFNNQAINIPQQPPQSPFTAHRKMCQNTGCKQSRNRAINTYNKRICSGKSELFKQCNHQKLNKPYSESKNLMKQDVAKIFLRITMINSENIADKMRGGIRQFQVIVPKLANLETTADLATKDVQGIDQLSVVLQSVE